MFKNATKMVLVLGLLASTCTGAKPPQEGSDPKTGTATAQSAAQNEEAKMTLTGTLAETVEKGGWVLNTEHGMYLLLFDQEYRKKDWFQVGAKVKITGAESPDTVTVFMQGTPFKVEKMEPAGEDQ